MKFDYILILDQKTGAKGKLALEYRFGPSEAWNELASLPESIDRLSESALLPSTLLAGKQHLQLRFAYTDEDGWYSLIDNVVIAPSLQHTVSYVADPVGAGTFTDGSGTLITQQQVNYGDSPAAVKANPTSGYTFAHWDDGSLTATKTSGAAVFEDRTETAHFVGSSEVFIAFTATPADGGHFQVGNDDHATSATLPKGANLTVTAIPTDGYAFLYWQNGVKTQTLTLENAQESTQLTAAFVRIYRQTAAFRVTDGTAPLANATITINGQTLTTDADGKASSQQLNEGSYHYTVHCDRYLDTEGDLQLSLASGTVTVALNSLLTVLVTDQEGKPLGNATISIAGKSGTTNAQEEAPITLPNGTYPYRVDCSGYQPSQGELTVLGESRHSVKLAPKPYLVTFRVMRNTTPLRSATVKINGQTLTTKAGGVATVELVNGTYPYTVSKNDYEDATGSVTVNNDNVTEEVVLKRLKTNGVETSTLLADVSIYPNPCDKALYLQRTASVRLVQVVNAKGQTVLSQTHDGAPTLTLSTEELAADIYLLQLTDTQGGGRTLRFVKQ